MKQRSTIASARQKTTAERRLERARSPYPTVQTFRLEAENKPLIAPEASITMQEQLNKERLREIQLKHTIRIAASVFFALLLALQNWQVFSIIHKAFAANNLKDLQLIFAALVGATLTETYFITKIIINFVFSNTDYSYQRNEKL